MHFYSKIHSESYISSVEIIQLARAERALWSSHSQITKLNKYIRILAIPMISSTKEKKTNDNNNNKKQIYEI